MKLLLCCKQTSTLEGIEVSFGTLVPEELWLISWEEASDPVRAKWDVQMAVTD